MLQIQFEFNQQLTIIQSKFGEKFKIVIDKYMKKSLFNPNNIIFLVKGKKINPEEKVENQMNEIDKKNKNLKVFVQLIKEENTNVQETFKSKEIICPICYELCRIKFDNYKLELFGCINNHITKDIKIKDFPNTQKINITNIICQKCKIKNIGSSSDNEFYKCLTCNQNLCLICRSNHNLNHKIINYTQKNYICQKHNEQFTKYCFKCNKNICYSCDEEHKEHEIILLGNIKPNMSETKGKLLKVKKEIDIFNNNIKNIIMKLNELNDSINIFYEIYNNIINSYENQNRNYQILQNIKEINFNNKIFNTLLKLNKINDTKEKFYNFIEFYNNFYFIEENEKFKTKNYNEINNNENNTSSSNKLNKLTIIYKIDKNKDKIKLFGEDFVENNKNNSYLIIDGKKNELCSYIELNEIQKNKDILEIKLIETKKITNMENMFNRCSSLISLPDFDNWNTENITDMFSIFGVCSSLKSLPDISKWNTKNIKNFASMFQSTTSLESLPDISKWDTRNVKDMSYMFSDCHLLKSLPDISEWDTKNVTQMNNMFDGCELLESLPDISKWNTKMLLT